MDFDGFKTESNRKGFAMINSYKLLLTTSTLTLAMFSMPLVEVAQSATISNSNNLGVSMMTEKPASNLVSVSSNWQQKLPSVRNQIIGKLEQSLKKLANGNQGYARVEALRVEGANLYVKILIHHKHEPSKNRWGIPQGIPYSLQSWVETKYNPLDKKSLEDSTSLCVRGPSVIGSPKMCVTAGEVRRIISAFL